MLVIAGITAVCVLVSPIGTDKIPYRYYNTTCLKPAHLTFYDWMTTLQMPPYEMSVFDCSQRAAYVEWLSESCEHKAILAGSSHGGGGHIWVMIEIGGVFFSYEPSWSEGVNPWVSHTYDWYYNPSTLWDSIYDAPWEHSAFEDEYAWWNTYPALVYGSNK